MMSMMDLWEAIHRRGGHDLPPTTTTLPAATASLPEVARQHADAHRWFESERRGRDVGPSAYSEWRRRYWRSFCRWRDLEHLLGVCRYWEFDARLFGSLRNHEAWSLDSAMAFALRHMLVEDFEQLNLLFEAPDELPRSRLLQILAMLNFNEARVNPPDWTH